MVKPFQNFVGLCFMILGICMVPAALTGKDAPILAVPGGVFIAWYGSVLLFDDSDEDDTK